MRLLVATLSTLVLFGAAGCSGGDETDAAAGPAAGGAGAAGAGGAGGAAGTGGVAPCPLSPEVGTLSDEDAPLSLAVDASHVYWTSAEPDGMGGYVHRIRRAPKAGGPAEDFADADGETGAVALTADRVVWVEGPPGGTGSGSSAVKSAPKAGGAPSVVATFSPTQGTADVFSLAVDDAAAYVLLKKFGATFRYTAFRAPLSGEKGGAVATHTLPVGTDARSMLVDGGDVLWAFLSGWVYRAPTTATGGPDVLPVLDVVDGVDGWTVRGDDILFLTGGSIRRVPRTGGEASDVLPGVDAWRALAAGPDVVAWGARDHTGKESIHARRAGGEACLLVTEGVVSVYSTAIDGDRLYWTNTARKKAGGAVRWVRLP